MKKTLLLCLIFILIPSCSKKPPPDPKERIVYIKTFREEKVPWAVYKCIEEGEVARNMTMEECNEAVKGTFVLTTKLEDDWGIWTHVGEHYTQNIYFNKSVAKDVNDMQMERLFKVFEIMRERKYY